MNDTVLETRLNELESRFTFHELTIDELNQAIFIHELEITKLREQFRILMERIKTIQSSPVASQSEEILLPPHF